VRVLAGWDEAILANDIIPQFSCRLKPARLVCDERHQGVLLALYLAGPQGMNCRSGLMIGIGSFPPPGLTIHRSSGCGPGTTTMQL
jgi:hypothetical protein